MASVEESMSVFPVGVQSCLQAARSSPARIFQWGLERCGFLVTRAADYYSPLPSRRKLKQSIHRWSKPSSMRGVEYDLSAMQRRVALRRGEALPRETLRGYCPACRIANRLENVAHRRVFRRSVHLHQ
jgi:hypothetical protein